MARSEMRLDNTASVSELWRGDHVLIIDMLIGSLSIPTTSIGSSNILSFMLMSPYRPEGNAWVPPLTEEKT